MLKLKGQSRRTPQKEKLRFRNWTGCYCPAHIFGWVNNKIRKGSSNSPSNGILYLKGGDYTEELKTSGLHAAKIWNLDELLPQADLGEKYLIHFKI